MATSILRYISVGFLVAAASVAWGDTLYMLSRPDGSFYFNRVPVSPSLSANDPQRRSQRAKRFIAPSVPGDTPGSGKSRYGSLVDEVARGYQIDSALLHAVVSVESGYNPKAQSPAGAVGLMQLMPATAKRYGVDDALDPEQNLHGGAQYLRDLLAMFGSDVRLALAAYHAGENAVTRHQNTVPPFETTMRFVSKVLDVYAKRRGSSGH
ncbi:MAG: lytic transglycosylase, catalytic [Rhodocyclaceae bacterium]|nr:lytic transglycosylase, catalytic [Rhodocyclaceae bacterium]